MLLEALKAFLFGVVEGITEWLPISSTGHMMLLNQFVNLDVSDAFYDTFLVVVQLGAIMAVIILYFHKLNPFSARKTAFEKRETWSIWAKVAVGSIPAAIVGFLFDDLVEENIMNNSSVAYIVVSVALITYGVIFIVMEARNRRLVAEALSPRGKHARKPAPMPVSQSVGATASVASKGGVFTGPAATYQGGNVTGPAASYQGAPACGKGKFSLKELFTLSDESEFDASTTIAQVRTMSDLSYPRAFCIGIFQALAVIPGTSRSGSIIIGSMLLGTSRTVAAEFAFFLAIPIMFGWSFLKFLKHGLMYTGVEWLILIIGVVVSFVVSVFVIKFLLSFIKKNDFTAFGIYRIVLAVLVLAWFGSQALL